MATLARAVSDRAAAADRETLLAAFDALLIELARLAPDDEAHRRSLLVVLATLER